MFKRKKYQELLNWKKENGKSALLIEGARRVGKSTLVSEFGKNEYKSFINIDFSIAPKIILNLFNDINDLNNLFLQLQTYYNVELFNRESVIIFDEIEYCPKARQAIKHLVNDNRYDYIETGSLISIKKNVNNILIPSEEKSTTLFPFDFEEFCIATNNEAIIKIINTQFENKQPMGEIAHNKALRLFRTYMLVGGMPQALQEYINTNNLSKVDSVKREILNLYIEDFNKIDSTGRIGLLFRAIPAELNKNSSRYHVSSVLKNRRSNEILHLISEMESSKTILLSYYVTDPNAGLDAYKDITKFKLFMNDTGLFITQMFNNRDVTDINVYKKLLLDNLPENLGCVYENAVANILKSSGHNLYYNTFRLESNPHNYEIDFLINESTKISPIEVKSSKINFHKSLDKFYEKYKTRINHQYLISTKDFFVKNNIINVPIYMAHLL